MFCHWSLLSSGVYVAWFCACECESWIIRAQNNVDTGIWKKRAKFKECVPLFRKGHLRHGKKHRTNCKLTVQHAQRDPWLWSKTIEFLKFLCHLLGEAGMKPKKRLHRLTVVSFSIFLFFLLFFFNFFNYFYLPGQDRKKRHRERGEQKIDFRVSDRIE